ncbi:MAG: hypothetical protein H7326_02215 [Bdellovibrionaceae bacterium]|nr:hypothetical protein [Pseudobdellovibrionaceae bacterium]
MCIIFAGIPARAQLRSDLQLFSNSFLSPSFEATEKTNYQFAGVSLKSSPQSDDSMKMNIEGAVAFGAPLMNYLDISEFYFQTKTSETEKLFLGRKLMNWNELDNRWSLGLWQPLFQWNPLNPEAQGLSGIFWEAERSGYALSVFASPVFIPNQGPTFEIVNGQFVPGNPWFRRPPESVRIFSESTRVDYNFEKPNESQVVFQASYGARLQVGSADSTLLQLSYMYKPSNELAIGYAGILDTGTLRGVVDLKPVVFFQTLTGLDLTQRWGGFRMGISGVLDRPQKDIDFEDRWTRPVMSDAYLVSPFIEYGRPNFLVTVQSLNIYGGEVREVGDMASADRAPLTMIYPYQQAIKATLDNKFQIRGFGRVLSRFAYTASQKNDFDYVQWSLNYKMSNMWSLFTELDMLKAGDTSKTNQNEIAQFKNDDRFMIGAAHVF